VIGSVGQTVIVADEVFVGRRDEQERFAALLGELAGTEARSARRWRRRPSSEDPGDASKSRVVLVYGLGGSGKSRLLRQFQGMATGKVRGSPVTAGQVRTVWLDWEDKQRDDPGSYAGVAGPSLVTVLDAVQQAVVAAVGDSRAEQAFSDYRQGAARMPGYAARFAEVVAQSRQAGSPFTATDAAALGKAAVSAGMLAVGHPGGLLGLTPDQVAAVGQAGGHLSEAAARAVTGKKPGEISRQEYDLVTDPARELTRRSAAAVRTIAGRGPLVVFLDTGEVIGDRAWGWLRREMTQTGPQVVWVAGARFETEAEAGADSPVALFVREIGDEFLVRMSPARFDDAMIRDYLQARPNAPSYADGQIDVIARFTRGLPLAVSFTATLLDGGQPVEQVCREVDEGFPSSVVSRLARRYLVHAEQQAYAADDPRRDDVTKILALVLAFGDLRRDPDLLAALWDTEDPLAAFQDLARRHDFVLPVSWRLHDDVRDTLRTDLLEPGRRLRARPINERALAWYRARLAELRTRWSTLDEQLVHTGYTTTLLGMLWHALWVSNQEGLDLFVQILPVLAAADPDTADAAAGMVDQFVGIFDHDQRHDLDLLTQAGTRPFLFHGERGREIRELAERRVKVTLPGLALHPPSQPADEPLIGEPGEREVAVQILRADLQAGDDDEAAVATLRRAAALTHSTRLQGAIGSHARDFARRLIFAGLGGISVPTGTGLAAAKLATEMLTGDAWSWRSYAAALYGLGRLEDSLAACDEAIALDPNNAPVHNTRGNALAGLGRLEDSLAAYDQAIALDPSYAAFHTGRGGTLFGLGRLEDALAAFDEAVALGPSHAIHHSNRGVVLQILGRFEGALAAYDEAIALDPGGSPAHANKGIVLAVTGDLDHALTEFDLAERLTQDGGGEGKAWAGAILWHRRDPAGARERFALVNGQVTGCTPFHTAEMEAIALCALGQPNDAEQHLRRALPQRAAGDAAESRTIYDLLSDPPLLGIDRLRAIIENEP
jgi:tetratricopeptide (TPR) repeat protein